MGVSNVIMEVPNAKVIYLLTPKVPTYTEHVVPYVNLHDISILSRKVSVLDSKVGY